MKKIAILLLFISTSVFSQAIRVNGDMSFIRPNNTDNLSVEMKKISEKKYATINFEEAYVDNFKDAVFLRYNIFDDQMEFVKSEETYYLKKNLKTKIDFKGTNKTYMVFNLSNEPNYFRVVTSGKSASLLAKEIVKFSAAKAAKTSYDSDKPAKFERKDDDYYLSFNGVRTIEIPRRKKDFYNLFNDNSNSIKSFMKKNRLSHKDEDDLKKIIVYYNNL